MKTRTQKRVVGDIVKIDLGDGSHNYARVLEEGQFAFYDGRINDEPTIDRIIALRVLFYASVMDYAVKKGRWRIVGNAPLDNLLKNPPPRFMQDALRKDVFRIYEKGGKIRPATKEECIGLERTAAWDPDHIEDRLRDHYAGRINKWVESLRIKE